MALDSTRSRTCLGVTKRGTACKKPVGEHHGSYCRFHNTALVDDDEEDQRAPKQQQKHSSKALIEKEKDVISSKITGASRARRKSSEDIFVVSLHQTLHLLQRQVSSLERTAREQNASTPLQDDD